MRHNKDGSVRPQSMQGHTPGPWTVTVNGIKSPDGHIVYFDKSGGPHETDARLIAAAPELLDIARAYHNLLRTMAHTDGEVSTFEHIGEVIAKATGQQ